MMFGNVAPAPLSRTWAERGNASAPMTLAAKIFLITTASLEVRLPGDLELLGRAAGGGGVLVAVEVQAGAQHDGVAEVDVEHRGDEQALVVVQVRVGIEVVDPQ